MPSLTSIYVMSFGRFGFSSAASVTSITPVLDDEAGSNRVTSVLILPSPGFSSTLWLVFACKLFLGRNRASMVRCGIISIRRKLENVSYSGLS